MNIDRFYSSMKDQGWVIFDNVLPSSTVNQLRLDLQNAYTFCRDLQIKNGLEIGTDGSVHHLLTLSDNFISLLEFEPLHQGLENYFQSNYILNSFGGFINTKESSTYVSKVHRDIRTFSGDLPLMLNMLIMLDDFTEENGATYLLSHSHLMPDKPADEYFFQNASRAIGKAGSILLFNSNLWHAAGKNQTNNPRRALTLTFTKPFMKQQFDYPRALGYERSTNLSEKLLQVIGYNSRIPENLNEWYQPADKRLYKQGQG